MLGFLQIALLSIWIAQPSGQGPSHYPILVERILSGPRSQTSEFDWTVTWLDKTNEGLVERYSTRTDGPTIWEENRGDESGFHARGYERISDGTGPDLYTLQEIPRDQLAGTRNTLQFDEQVLNIASAEAPMDGSVAPITQRRGNAPIDLLAIGLVPRLDSPSGTGLPFQLPPGIAEGLAGATFDTRPCNIGSTVHAQFGEFSLVWTFDAARGQQPVKAELFENDRLRCFSETQVEEIDGRWIPRDVRFYRGDSAAPYKMIDVHSATFDKPWHQKEISPSDLGAVTGTQLMSPDGTKFWTGFELVNEQDYWDLVHVFDLKPDRFILETTAKILEIPVEEYIAYLQRNNEPRRAAYKKKHGTEPWLAVASRKPKDKDEWDLYVEKFLAEHKLPEPGVERAKEILKSAKNLRDARRSQNAAKMREAQKEGDARKIEHFEEIEKSIFDRVLVRSLKKLIPGKKEEPAESTAPTP